MEARELEKCIDAFGTDIYRFCIKICLNKTDAEDLYQQTFLKALESDWQLDWEQNPKALFFSMAHNLWKSDIRKAARRNAIAQTIKKPPGTVKSRLFKGRKLIKKRLEDIGYEQ